MEEIEETVTYSSYQIEERVANRLAPGSYYYKEIALRCPRCEEKGPPLEHGRSRLCRCGLSLQRWGNALVLRGVPTP